MNKEELETTIASALEQRRKKLVNRNAIRALFGALDDPLGALGQVFFGRADVIEDERRKLQQDTILDLVCKIDDALAEAVSALKASGERSTIVDGLVETHGVNTNEVTGVHVDESSGQVEFRPGTHIRTAGSDVGTLTGLHIGGRKKDQL
jgi:hypothetical protein